MGKLILVRHGQTNLNIGGIYFGKLNPELNEVGLVQAENAKTILKNCDYDKIYSSDLLRAKQTAEIINHKRLEIVYEKSLQELDFGIFEGLTYTEIKEKYPVECAQSEKDWENFNYITGESPKEMQKRVINFINTLDLKQNNLIVTHWGVINSILSYYMTNGLVGYWKFAVDNGGVCIIEFVDNFPVLKGLNIG